MMLSRPAVVSKVSTKVPSAFVRRLSSRAGLQRYNYLSSASSNPLTSQVTRPWRGNLGLWTKPSPASARTIFIQTEATPNTDALKFLPNYPILPKGLSTPFLEYLTPRATLAAPHPSPLAAQLIGIEGITSVFYGTDSITITKNSETSWAHIKPEVFSLITEAVSSGSPIVTEAGQGVAEEHQDSLEFNEKDSEVVGMIKELLETRIRPAIQEDGGDIEYKGFENGIVLLKLRGACRTCDSSTVTLRNGIESMLMHYIEEVKSVHQVLDQEEEVAIQEFARFEEKLKAQKNEDEIAPASLNRISPS